MNLIVKYNGKPRLKLNEALLNKMNAWDNLEEIKLKHMERLNLEEEMNSTNDRELLMLYDQLYTEIEYELQDLWGFGRNKLFHRFWNRPKCTCPYIDNEDNYPFGFYVVSGSCLIHGGF